MNTPFFSIIIPTFNRKSFLEKTLPTVFDQTFPGFECMVIDDGSTDGTEEFIKSIEDERLIYLKKENEGPSAARNRGLEISKGEWIAFLDSDDWWEPHKLERFSVEIEANPHIQIFHSEEVWFKNGKRHNPKIKHQKPTGRVFEQALPLCCISISTAVIHQDVFKDVGMFDESLPACEDYDFWLRVTHKYEVKLIEEYLTLKDGGRPDQLSFSMWGLDRFRIQALVKILSSGDLQAHEQTQVYEILEKKCRIFAQGALKRGKEEESTKYLQIIETYKV